MEKELDNKEDWSIVIACLCGIFQIIFLWKNWDTYNYIFYYKLGLLFVYSLVPYFLIVFIKLMHDCYVNTGEFDGVLDTAYFYSKVFFISIICALLIVYCGKKIVDYYYDFINSNYYNNLSYFFEGIKGAIK